jgi:hypothetical protein
VTPSAFHDWLHKLPASHVQALRDFRRCARAAHPGDDYLAAALDAGDVHELLQSAADPRKELTHQEAAAVIAAMPRRHVLMIDGNPGTIDGAFTEVKALPAP